MNWVMEFPDLAALGASDRELLMEQGAIMQVPKDAVIFGPGKTANNFVLLLEGSVRVQQISEKGREIVLYRVRAGESCVMTTACMLSSEKYSAEGIAESAVRAVAIPLKAFDQLMSGSVDFRHFVLSAYSTKIVELFRIIEDVAFQRVDIRLAEKILELASGNSIVRLTHRQLAVELGTAREVVSRQLSEFQRRHWLKQSRGTIEIVDFAGLKQLASA